jgi:hypothetical protein
LAMQNRSRESVKNWLSCSCASRCPMNSPIWPADRAQQLEQFRIRRPELPAEELHHARDLPVGDDREAERGMQPVARGHSPRGEIGILQHVGDPGGFPRGPDPARQSHAGREAHATARLDEHVEAEGGHRPRGHAAQDVGGTVHLPESAVLPSQRLADRAERRGRASARVAAEARACAVS